MKLTENFQFILYVIWHGFIFQFYNNPIKHTLKESDTEIQVELP